MIDVAFIIALLRTLDSLYIHRFSARLGSLARLSCNEIYCSQTGSLNSSKVDPQQQDSRSHNETHVRFFFRDKKNKTKDSPDVNRSRLTFAESKAFISLLSKRNDKRRRPKRATRFKGRLEEFALE